MDHFRRWLVRQSSAFPIISPASSSCWEFFWDGLSADFCVPSGGFRICCIKFPRRSSPQRKLKPLTYLKYAILLVMVFLLPAFLVNDVGMGDPFFCKVPLPAGCAGGAIPLSLANSGIRAALGSLFTWKFSILLAVIVLSVVFYRPFCKWRKMPTGCILCAVQPWCPSSAEKN